jgi:O-antigen/teichoic acid export membrane protein
MVTATPLSLAAAPVPRVPRLYRDAFSLASSSMLTAVLGIGFWAVCARVISPATLGVQTALLSIIVAPAIVVASGVGDAFTAIVPAAGSARARVVAQGYRLLLVTAGCCGVGAAVVAVTVLPQVRGSVPTALTVLVGVMIWSLFIVQDPALTAMRRAHWLPVENGTVSVAKIALLPLAILVGVGHPVIVATLIPSVLAIAVLFPQVRRLARLAQPGSERFVAVADPLGELPRLVRRTTTSVALSLGTLTLTPFIVTAAAGPSQGAVFSLALSVVQSLDFVGAALGVSLVVHASTAADESGDMALAVFKRTAAVVGIGAGVLIAISPFVLRALNPRYVTLHGAEIITILAVGSFVRCGYVIWAALQRARRQMRALLGLNAVAATSVLATIAPIAHHWGAVGAAVVIASAQVLLSAGAALHLLLRRSTGRAAVRST